MSQGRICVFSPKYYRAFYTIAMLSVNCIRQFIQVSAVFFPSWGQQKHFPVVDEKKLAKIQIGDKIAGELFFFGDIRCVKDVVAANPRLKRH